MVWIPAYPVILGLTVAVDFSLFFIEPILIFPTTVVGSVAAVICKRNNAGWDL
jgi:hypothetical protein